MEMKMTTRGRALLLMASILAATIVFAPRAMAQEKYTPAPANLEARQWFQDAKFGMFIHWGVYSVLGNGEWVMETRPISGEEYAKLPGFFNPHQI
jgi:alpha-L-fucosidase